MRHLNLRIIRSIIIVHDIYSGISIFHASFSISLITQFGQSMFLKYFTFILLRVQMITLVLNHCLGIYGCAGSINLGILA